MWTVFMVTLLKLNFIILTLLYYVIEISCIAVNQFVNAYVENCPQFSEHSDVLQNFLSILILSTKLRTQVDSIQLTSFLAQREGFEPPYVFLRNTISSRARSTTPPSLQF